VAVEVVAGHREGRKIRVILSDRQISYKRH
jgi:hypothetical protein